VTRGHQVQRGTAQGRGRPVAASRKNEVGLLLPPEGGG